jgi:psp operon transcriptional activator
MAFELGYDVIPRFSREASRDLETYHWPGNIRELKNVVERAVYRSDSPTIRKIDFNPFGYEKAPEDISNQNAGVVKGHPTRLDDFSEMPFGEAVKALEMHLLKRALETSKYNQRKAAGTLGLSYNQFRGIYRKYKDNIL